MRVLANVRPTSEQLPIINDYRSGPFIIRGAAGSGKTTTAVLRLHHVVNVWRSAAERNGDPPVRVLVLSFNLTLRGYIEELVRTQVRPDHVDLVLDTFAGWAMRLAGRPTIASDRDRIREIGRLGRGLGLDTDFLAGEVDYVAGRYGDPGEYLDRSNRALYDRHGRGSPPMPLDVRARLVSEVIQPYEQWKRDEGVADWNDVALRAAKATVDPYDVVVVDEAQDFSANMVRAVLTHLSAEASSTFVLDAVQRVYPHAFKWAEVGIRPVNGRNLHVLRGNHRNTKRIAQLAAPLVAGLPPDDDGTIPNFDACVVPGEMPVVVRGRFESQMDAIIEHIADLPSDESIGLLHPKGGDWFNYVRERLRAAGLPFVELQRRSSWPQGPEQIGLSTFHSVKGLEFDHVVVLGIEQRHMPHGDEDDDTQLALHRKLLAMAIGRARRTVMLTYKPETAPTVLDWLDPDTYDTDDR